MEQHKKPIRFSPSQREAMILKILKLAENNPEYKKHVEAKLAEKMREIEEEKQKGLEFRNQQLVASLASEMGDIDSQKEDKTFHIPKRQLSENEYKELRSKLNSGQMTWEELPSELKRAYSRYGSEERSKEWEELSQKPSTGIGEFE